MNAQQYTQTLSKQDSSNTRIAFEIFIACIPYVILPFSAPIAFFVALALLFLLAFFYPSNFTRYFLALCIIVSGVITFGDVPVISDITNYYRTYQNIVYKDTIQAIFSYGGGVEFIVPLYWTLWSFIVGDISPVSFMFLNAATLALLFYIWLEHYEIKSFNKKEAALCVFLALLMFYYYMSTHLLRQMYSTIFILFALSQHTRFKTLLFIALGFFSHVSAPLFFALFYILRHHYKIGLCIVGFLSIILLLGGLLPFLFAYASFLPPFFANKLGYYVEYVEKFSPYNIKTIILIGIIIFGLYYHKRIDSRWTWIIIGYAILLLSAQISLVHLLHRFSSIYLYIPLGYFLFLVLRNNKYLLIMGCILAFFAKAYVFFLQVARNYPQREWSLFHYGFGGEWFYYIIQ